MTAWLLPLKRSEKPNRSPKWVTIGWHTFRHSYSTLLVANGENVKVVQALMRHASSRFTLEVYSQARIEAKREAQRRLAQTILSEEHDVSAPAILSSPGYRRPVIVAYRVQVSAIDTHHEFKLEARWSNLEQRKM